MSSDRDDVAIVESVGPADLYRHSPDGYEMMMDPETPAREAGCIMHHRVIAYAHGELDDPWEPLEVDHLTEIPWLNYAENLEAVGPIEHGRRTWERRMARVDGGSTA